MRCIPAEDDGLGRCVRCVRAAAKDCVRLRNERKPRPAKTADRRPGSAHYEPAPESSAPSPGQATVLGPRPTEPPAAAAAAVSAADATEVRAAAAAADARHYQASTSVSLSYDVGRDFGSCMQGYEHSGAGVGGGQAALSRSAEVSREPSRSTALSHEPSTAQVRRLPLTLEELLLPVQREQQQQELLTWSSGAGLGKGQGQADEPSSTAEEPRHVQSHHRV